jgi:hypothetical protein
VRWAKVERWGSAAALWKRRANAEVAIIIVVIAANATTHQQSRNNQQTIALGRWPVARAREWASEK